MLYGSKPSKIVVFVDDDNISANQKTKPPEKFNDELGFQKFQNWLSGF